MAGGDLIFEACANCSTIIQQIQYADLLTDVGFGGVLGLTFMIIIALVLFLVQKAFAFEKALATSLLITAFCGVLLAAIGILSNNILYVAITFFVASIFILLKSQNN